MKGDGRAGRIAATALVLVGVWGFLLVYFQPSLLLLDTMNAGGDTPSFLRPIHHLRDFLLPAGQPLGFDLGNFAGYAPYQFYFLPPSLGIVALSTLIPFNIAFKLMTVAGTFLLPLTTALALRALGQRFPVPAIGAAASLLFLFNEGNSMWGGNIQSTLAGEFAFSLAFSLAVLFLGLLYRGGERQRGSRSLGALLAFIGLCHPVAFLNAATPGLFFLLSRRDFARNLRFLLAAYGTAVLLMGFWLLPLVAKLGYATSINWTWEFSSFEELLPPIFWPAAALAALDVAWVLPRRRPDDRPTHYLAFSGLATAFCFLNATEVGLPEIRFVPFTYMILILLAVDFLRRILRLEPERWPEGPLRRFAPHAGALTLALLAAAWTQSSTTAIARWIQWNYEGLERKPAYPLLRALTGELEGSIGDPRIAYENSPLHDRFGSMRVFENLALFTGRATLEGVLLQTAPTSPYIYWLQSQISKLGTHVIPGYGYPDFDPTRAAPRLALFNARDLIARTPELRAALDADARWERTFVEEPYAIYRLREADPHYVRVPRFAPVLLESPEWKRNFHRWFANDATLDIPLVAARSMPEEDRVLFPQRSASPDELPRVPLDVTCAIDERIDHLAIEFTTSCPGRP
ncbi:MAG: 6-pyruvoyl-tetrahydropterin synthase-related protein, partial [Myxococcota bacterium]